LVLTRCNLGNESSFGVTIGGVPIFLTDAFVGILVLLTLNERPAQLVIWAFTGTGAGPVGLATWLICLSSLVYAIFAFHEYQIYALRDLAAFGYCLFFPLTYFAVTRRSTAVKLTRYFTYSIIFGAVLLLAEALSRSSLGLFETAYKGLGAYSGSAIEHPATGDLGANLGFGLAALLAYVFVDDAGQNLHNGIAAICLAGLVIALDRSAMLGAGLAIVPTYLLLDSKRKAQLWVTCGILTTLMLIAVALPDRIPGGHALRAPVIALSSAFGGAGSDADFMFRIRRWTYVVNLWAQHPIFGVGFGTRILPFASFWGNDEPGQFNFGMPHNSYLTILARTGLVGFLLFAFCLLWTARDLVRKLWQQTRPDESAVLNMLVAMVVFAGLNLFFERPLLCGPFWIMLGVAARMGEPRRHLNVRIAKSETPVRSRIPLIPHKNTVTGAA
jgi:O-antigen ligase